MREQLALDMRKTARAHTGEEVDVSAWPDDSGTVLVEVLSEPDGHGRQHFICRWWQGEHPRGQVSFAWVEDAVRRWKAEGKTVEVRRAAA